MSTHRSFSAVKTFRLCGEQYRLNKIEHAIEQPMVAGLAGRAIHTATEIVDLEIHAGEKDPETLAQLANRAGLDAFTEEVEKALSERYPDQSKFMTIGRRTKEKPGGEDVEWFRRDGIPRAIVNYVTWRTSHPELVIYELPGGVPAIEVPFSFHTLGGVEIKGAIDRVFVNDTNGAKVVTDLKSGRKPESSEQLGVYRLALESVLTDESFRYGIYVYAMKKELQVTPDIDLAIWTPERISAIYDTADVAITNNLFMAKPGEACFMCTQKGNCEFYPASVF